MYPMMLALLALLRKVWQKAANPIWARDHPMAIMVRRAGEVLLKKGVFKATEPSIKKTRLVMMQSKKLKIK
jgi:hypothetical protein